MEYYILALMWIVWCVIHSWLISVTAIKFFKRALGSNYRYFRLFYNITAIATLLVVIFYANAQQGPTLFTWSGPLVIIQSLAIGIVAYLGVAGMLAYDMLHFLGVSQIKSGASHSTLSEVDEFKTTGILGVSRHPWYLAAIILIWVNYHVLDSYKLLTNLILTGYLIIGTLLEERKLLLEFGDVYRDYQQKVSMLFPIKWLKSLV